MSDLTYILLSDPRFVKEAKSEICLPPEGAKELIIDKYTHVLSVPSELRIYGSQIFTYSLIPAQFADFSDITDLSAPISGSLKPGLSFRIFLIDASSQFDSNREIEIKLGEGIESEEHLVDLTKPDCAVLLIIKDTVAIFGIAEDSASVYAIRTIFRPLQEKTDYISRAESKLEEAILRFGIDLSIVDTCIDIGAAPGGWTDLMLRNGKRVIAVDKAELEYKQLRRYGPIEIVAEPEEQDKMKRIAEMIDPAISVCASGASDRKFRLIHIKSNFKEAAVPIPDQLKAEMLMVDSNTHYTESIRCALELSRFVKSGGLLLLTIKINNRHPKDAIEYALSELPVSYSSITFKKLIKNRREITLFAKRISS